MSVFEKAAFLVPDDRWIQKWPVIACDQFTSQSAYWEEEAAFVGDAPSALRLIYPEVYLSDEMDRRIASINAEMESILHEDVLHELNPGFVYIERTLMNGKIRRGLLGVIDLDAYSYASDADTPVRATEKTVPERIPPRVRIRRDAPLELSHVLLFMDDPEDQILGPLEKNRDLPCLYDLDLPQGGGHLVGRMLTPSVVEATEAAIAAYEAARRAAATKAPVLYLVGDGNHSLATAKTCYEELKKSGADEKVLKQARYAMVELGNIRDSAMDFEPIHRVVTHTDPAMLLERMRREIGAQKGYRVRWYAGAEEGEMELNPEMGELPVAIVQNFLDRVLCEMPGSMDYIHGEEALRELASQDGALGVALPAIGKDAFFKAIEVDGVLPRKTFSIGHAQEKRYYLEARRIR